jgi:Flp pilus assembly pilin Flp
MTKFIHFLRDDAGAVTIDWVALTAGILLLGIMVVYAIFNNGVSSLVDSINSTLEGVTTNVSTGTTPNINS